MDSVNNILKDIVLPQVIKFIQNEDREENISVIRSLINAWYTSNLFIPIGIIEEIAKTGSISLIELVLGFDMRPNDNRSIEYAREHGHYYVEQILISQLSSIEI